MTRLKSWLPTVLATTVVATGVVLAVVVIRASEGGRGIEAAAAGEGASIADGENLLTDAKPSREILVGLAARPGGPVDFLVFGGNEDPIARATLRVKVSRGGEHVLSEGQCGVGCYRLSEKVLAGKPTDLSVAVERDGLLPRRLSFSLPERLPPAADAVVRAAVRTMRRVQSLRIDETLSAGLSTLRSRWRMQAPDRFSVVASDGGRSVLIGRRRWDWIGGRWEYRSYPRTRFPSFNWTTAGNARLVGRAAVAGRPTSIVSAFDSSRRWWFRLWIDNQTRVLKVEMFAPSHFMRDRYSGFNVPLAIRPPVE